jgi:hypothetical protein
VPGPMEVRIWAASRATSAAALVLEATP